MAWPKGKPRKTVDTSPQQKRPRAAFRSIRDLISMMDAYRASSGGKFRGLFEDCKAEIYNVFAVDIKDKQVDEMKATSSTDRFYGEWERRFSRAIGRRNVGT